LVLEGRRDKGLRSVGKEKKERNPGGKSEKGRSFSPPSLREGVHRWKHAG